VIAGHSQHSPSKSQAEDLRDALGGALTGEPRIATRARPGREGAAFHLAIYSSRMAPTACDKASPIAFIALHTCAAYVSKAAI
jgi:hypothetical protein